MWSYLLLGIGLFLVLEGIFPFVSPDQYKDYLRKMLGWKKDENVKNTSKRNVFTGVIQIMRKRNQQLRKQYNRKGLIDFYYTPTT